MPPQFTAFLGRIGTGIKNFTAAQKFLAVLGIALLTLGGIALTTWMAKPAMTPLFTGLQAADASAVVEQLRKDNVPFELTGGGQTILVPEEKVYDERLKAAQAGLPTAAATGYNLLDKMGVTASEFQQNVTYKRALEGELGSTIGAMDGVKAASVRLAIPEKTVFVSKVADPTASVFLETNPGTTLSSDKVQAIVHLTSSAIENLKPTNVSVVDAAGNVLSAVGTGTSGTADKKATDYEQRVSNAVKTVLDRVVGPGNATVAVAADVTQESAKRTQETFANAEGTAPLNETTKTEEYTGTGGGTASGVLGPDNIAVPGGTSGNGTFKSEDSTRNNAVNKTTEDRTIPSGALNRQTVSVAIDRAAAAQVDVQALQSLVSTAAGINTARGDQVTVQVVPFSTASADAAAKALADDKAAKEAADQAGMMQNIIIGGVIALVALLVLIFLIVRNRRQRREPMDMDPEPQPLPALPLEPETTAIVQLPPVVPVPEIEPLPAPGEEVLSMERKRAQIGALATSEPAKTADYLRAMMTEEKANV